MIVSSLKTGVLEVFWRHRINRPFTPHAVQDFFSGFTRQSDLQSLRRWLAKDAGWSASSNAGDAAVIEFAAAAVASGELVVAEHRLGQRYPGTGILIRLLSGPVLILARRKLRPTRDLEYALQWVRGVIQPDEIQRARSMLSHFGGLSAFQNDSADFSTTFEKLLQSGQLIPVYHPYTTGSNAEGAPANPPTEEPAKGKRDWPDREESVDASTFLPDHAILAQVAAVMAAAEHGIPFCEECNKERPARSTA